MKELADVALDAAKGKGASYADIRINRFRRQFIFSREECIQNTVSLDAFGFGVRALVDGVWGFAAASRVDKDTIARMSAVAVETARANKILQKDPIVLVPVPAVNDTWQTPITKSPFRVSTRVKADLLLALNAAAMKNGASFVNSAIFAVEEDKFFASTDGSYISQLLTRVWPTFQVTCVDKTTGMFQTRGSLATPIGTGWEYVEGYPLVDEAALAAEQCKQKLTAKSVAPGKKDLVLSPEH